MELNIESEKWVVLVDYTAKIDYEAFKNDSDMAKYFFMPFHIEPLKTFINRPPHFRWKLYKNNITCDEAWNFIESDEAKELIKYILENNGFNYSEESNNKTHRSYNRFDILKRDNYKCQICGRGAEDGVKLEIDHKIPRAKNGSDDPDNLWVLCFDCNRSKTDKDL